MIRGYMSGKITCSYEGCDRENYGRRYCNMHRYRLKKGKPLGGAGIRDHRPAIIEGDIAKIPIGVDAKDGYAIVDANMSKLDAHRWSDNHGYAYAAIDGKLVAMHHLIIKRHSGLITDHINRNRLDNRACNLRLVTRRQNSINSGAYSKLFPGVKGVRKTRNKYTARITINGKRIHIGTYNTIQEAAQAYNRMAVQHFGEYAVLNQL